MKTAIFIPPLPRMSGGVAVLLQIGENLHRSGHDVCFVWRDDPGVDHGCIEHPAVPMCHWDDITLGPEHIWLVAEGWPNALAPGLAGGAQCVVYVQNWAFMLGNLPEGVRWEQLPLRFLSVSDPVRWFVQRHTGMDSPVLRPVIDPQRFHPALSPTAPQEILGAALPPGSPVRIAWMPRKNKALAQQIRLAVEARLPYVLPQGPQNPGLALEWVEIHGRRPDEVAEMLRASHIFLVTGFPEGCPLPPLEAMASGCLVAGYSGLGGWDYMRQALPEMPFALRPWWPLRDVPWGGNGIFVADADVPGAACAVEEALKLLFRGGPELAALRRNAAATAAAYSMDAQAEEVVRIWQSLAPGA